MSNDESYYSHRSMTYDTIVIDFLMNRFLLYILALLSVTFIFTQVLHLWMSSDSDSERRWKLKADLTANLLQTFPVPAC